MIAIERCSEIVHRNPLIADLFHRMGEVEKVGSGIRRIRKAAADARVPAPKFEVTGFFTITFPKSKPSKLSEATGQVTPQVTTQVKALLRAAFKEARSREDLQEVVGIKNREHFRKAYLEPLLTRRWLVRTIPDKPHSSKQRYATTVEGREFLKKTKERR